MPSIIAAAAMRGVPESLFNDGQLPRHPDIRIAKNQQMLRAYDWIAVWPFPWLFRLVIAGRRRLIGLVVPR